MFISSVKNTKETSETSKLNKSVISGALQISKNSHQNMFPFYNLTI